MVLGSCGDWSGSLRTMKLNWHHSGETRTMALGFDETIGVLVMTFENHCSNAKFVCCGSVSGGW